MKTIETTNSILTLGIIISLTMLSCEETFNNDIPGFSIQFSNGTIIKEDNLQFYDSSKCIFFLKQNVKFKISEEENPESFVCFSVFLDDQRIYEGIVYPGTKYNLAPKQTYILSRTFPDFESNFIEIRHFNDAANDQRIINYFGEKNMLNKGISCIIDTVYALSFSDSTTIYYSISIQNHDSINYYIIDPEKYGMQKFISYTGGLVLTEITELLNYYPLHCTDSSYNYNVYFDGLTVLSGNAKISYNLSSKYYPAFESGTYNGYFNFLSVGLINPINIPLNQEDGRIWVGQTFSKKSNIEFSP